MTAPDPSYEEMNNAPVVDLSDVNPQAVMDFESYNDQPEDSAD